MTTESDNPQTKPKPKDRAIKPATVKVRAIGRPVIVGSTLVEPGDGSEPPTPVDAAALESRGLRALKICTD